MVTFLLQFFMYVWISIKPCITSGGGHRNNNNKDREGGKKEKKVM
jgi:hypothetical protein